MRTNRGLTIKALCVIAMGVGAFMAPQRDAAALATASSTLCYTCDPESGPPCSELTDAEVECIVNCSGHYTGQCFDGGDACPENNYLIECTRA